jgi:hypothetical protein
MPERLSLNWAEITGWAVVTMEPCAGVRLAMSGAVRSTVKVVKPVAELPALSRTDTETV